jgi:cation transport ATPase
MVEVEQNNSENTLKKESKENNIFKAVFNFIKILAAGFLIYIFLYEKAAVFYFGQIIIAIVFVFSIIYNLTRSDFIKKKMKKIISFSFNFSLIAAYAFLFISLVGRFMNQGGSYMDSYSFLPYLLLFIFFDAAVLLSTLMKIAIFIIDKSSKIFLALFMFLLLIIAVILYL